MLIILLLVGIIAIVIAGIRMSGNEGDAFGMSLMFFGFVFSVVSIFCMVFAITNTVKIPQMAERITIYKEENTRIEEQIKTAIEAYQDYEQGIFEDIDLDKISSEKLILLTSIYPELKSDTMVQELMQVYINNTNEIKEIRIEKLNYEVWRWWLCFR